MLSEHRTENLSALQRRILLDATRGEIGAERTRRGKWCASDRAVFSRAVRRLESRGLVVIEHKRGRPPSVAITSQGQEIAKELSGDNLPSIADQEAQGEQIKQAYTQQIAHIQETHPVSTYRLERLLARSFPGVLLNWHVVALTMQGKRPRARRKPNGLFVELINARRR